MERSGPRGRAAILKVILACVELESRLFGTAKHDEDTLRYAGSDPESIDDMMVERMCKKISERRHILAAYGMAPGLLGRRIFAFGHPASSAFGNTNKQYP